MTRTEDRAELVKLRAAVGTAHDHLHAGRVDDAHAALHCGGQADVHPENLSTDAAASLLRFSVKFNELARQHGIAVAWVALLPSASKEGYVSLQLGGAVPVIQHVRELMGMDPTNAVGGG